MVCCDVEGHGCLGFHMGGINISGRIKQSFYPRTRHGELKVISMIYAPPYLIRRRSEGDVDRSRTRNVSERSRGSTHEGNTGKQSTGKHSITTEQHKTNRHHTTQQRDTELSSRTVTSKLSGVSVHTTDTARLRWFRLFSYK